MIIAIDGPAGAGKSSVTKLVAQRLGFSCLDTGAMYRAVAWRAVQEGVDLADEEALGLIARTCEISFVHEPGNPSPVGVLIAGTDVSQAIRTAEIDKAVSPVSAARCVRQACTEQQRRIGGSGDYVVEGRDIGTVVFPDALVKIFLTASAEERARRRVAQNEDRGIGETDYYAVLADIVRRDNADQTREQAPLRMADDAVLIDTSDMDMEAVVARICEIAEAAGAGLRLSSTSGGNGAAS